MKIERCSIGTNSKSQTTLDSINVVILKESRVGAFI